MVHLPKIRNRCTASESPRKGGSVPRFRFVVDKSVSRHEDLERNPPLSIEQKRLIQKSLCTRNFEDKLKGRQEGNRSVSPADILQQALRSHAANVTALHVEIRPAGNALRPRPPKRSMGRLQYEDVSRTPVLGDEVDEETVDWDSVRGSRNARHPHPQQLQQPPQPGALFADTGRGPVLSPSSPSSSPRGEQPRRFLRAAAPPPSRGTSLNGSAMPSRLPLPPVPQGGGSTGAEPEAELAAASGAAGATGGPPPHPAGGILLQRTSSGLTRADQLLQALRGYEGATAGESNPGAAATSPTPGHGHALPYITHQAPTRQQPPSSGLRLPLSGLFRSSPNSPDMHRRGASSGGGGAAHSRSNAQPLAHAVAAVSAAQDYLQRSGGPGTAGWRDGRGSSPPWQQHATATSATPSPPPPTAAAAAAAAAGAGSVPPPPSVPLPQMPLSPRARILPFDRGAQAPAAASDSSDPYAGVERSAPSFSFGAMRLQLAELMAGSPPCTATGTPSAPPGGPPTAGGGGGGRDVRNLQTASVGESGIPPRSRQRMARRGSTCSGAVTAAPSTPVDGAPAAAATTPGGMAKPQSGDGPRHAGATAAAGTSGGSLMSAVQPSAEELFTRVSRSVMRGGRQQEWVPVFDAPLRTPSVFGAAACGASPYAALSGLGPNAEAVAAAVVGHRVAGSGGGAGEGVATRGAMVGSTGGAGPVVPGLRIPRAPPPLVLPGDASPQMLSPRGGVRLPPLADSTGAIIEQQLTPRKGRVRPSLSFSAAEGEIISSQLRETPAAPVLPQPPSSSPFADQPRSWRSGREGQTAHGPDDVFPATPNCRDEGPLALSGRRSGSESLAAEVRRRSGCEIPATVGGRRASSGTQGYGATAPTIAPDLAPPRLETREGKRPAGPHGHGTSHAHPEDAAANVAGVGHRVQAAAAAAAAAAVAGDSGLGETTDPPPGRHQPDQLRVPSFSDDGGSGIRGRGNSGLGWQGGQAGDRGAQTVVVVQDWAAHDALGEESGDWEDGQRLGGQAGEDGERADEGASMVSRVRRVLGTFLARGSGPP